MKQRKKYLFLFILLSISYSVSAVYIYSPDTVYLRKGQSFRSGNLEFKAEKDTVFFIDDSLHYEISTVGFDQTKALYDSIKEKANRSEIASKLYELAFEEQKNKVDAEDVEAQEGVTPFLPYQGKIIRNINYKVLDPIGPTIEDTSGKARSWLGEMGNDIHINTREHVLGQNLLFTKGDTLNPNIFSNSEKVLRDLPYIEDAEIYIIQASEDSVDILIIAKDLLPYGIDADAFGFDRGYIRVWNENFLGLGHKISSGVSIYTSADPLIRYDYGEYLINNISGSFIEGRLYYNRNDNLKEYGLSMRRRLIPYRVQLGGGLNIYKYEYVEPVYYVDSVVERIVAYDQKDLFLSKSIQMRENYRSTGASPFVIFSSRYQQRDFDKRQYVEIDSNRLYHNYRRWLMGFSLNKTDYYTSNYVFYYGRTEDIPYGFNVQLTGGYEWREFQERTYLGFSLSAGNFFENAGYFYGLLRTGGYFWKKDFQDGALSMRFYFLSELLKIRNLKIRNFITIDYTTGINRTYNDRIYLKEDYGLIGHGEENIGGQKRIFVNLHSVMFLPYSFYGFRFSFFYFGEFGMVGPLDRSIIDNKFYSGLGVGMRIKNENLVFNALEIRFTYYPHPLPGGDLVDVWIGGEEPGRFDSFHHYVPSVVPFE